MEKLRNNVNMGIRDVDNSLATMCNKLNKLNLSPFLSNPKIFFTVNIRIVLGLHLLTWPILSMVNGRWFFQSVDTFCKPFTCRQGAFLRGIYGSKHHFAASIVTCESKTSHIFWRGNHAIDRFEVITLAWQWTQSVAERPTSAGPVLAGYIHVAGEIKLDHLNQA